jgi:hypothetical protein
MWNKAKMVVAIIVHLILFVPGFIFDVMLNVGKIGGECCVDIANWFVRWAKE